MIDKALIDNLTTATAVTGIILLIASLLWWTRIRKHMRLDLIPLTHIVVLICTVAIVGFGVGGDITGRIGETETSDWLWLFTGITVVIVGVYMVFVTYIYNKTETGAGHVMISPEMFLGIHEKLESIYGAAAAGHIMYAFGKGAGYRDTVEMMKTSAVKGVEKNMNSLPMGVRLLGYARRVEKGEWEPGKRIVLKTWDTLETAGGRKANRMGCDIARGYFAGTCEAFYPDKTCEATETKCIVMGDAHCEFEIKWFEKIKPVNVKEE